MAAERPVAIEAEALSFEEADEEPSLPEEVEGFPLGEDVVLALSSFPETGDPDLPALVEPRRPERLFEEEEEEELAVAVAALTDSVTGWETDEASSPSECVGMTEL